MRASQYITSLFAQNNTCTASIIGRLWQCVLLACVCVLAACVPIVSDPVYDKYWKAQEKFADFQYENAEHLLEPALAELRKRPKDEPPSLWNRRVNVHNYSIMTLELLAKCKYAQGKYKELSPLLEEEGELLQNGYTGSFKTTPINGVKLYLHGFEAVTKLETGDFLAAQILLGQADDLQRLSDRNSPYVWLGDKGSPEFARYLWLNSKAQILQAQGKSAEAQLLDREAQSLRAILKLKPRSSNQPNSNPITLSMFIEHFGSAAQNPQAAVLNWLAPLETRYEHKGDFATAEAVYQREINLLEHDKEADQVMARNAQALLANVLDGYAKLLYKMHRDADATAINTRAKTLHRKAKTQPIHEFLR